jgi:4-diphosphocytidyl-2-C-methyl-D-erythritol kinase
MSDTDSDLWPAPAKLNLFLHITGRRPDGYHSLQTLFQILDWGDDIRVKVTRSPRIRRLNASYDVAEQDDLVIRAARLLQQETAATQGAEIEVIKRVPMGAGLGGGSSDAATALIVLNRLWRCGLNDEDLAVLAARLGADVPVFIHGHSAMAEGIGDRLQAVQLGERHYVLVLPGISISTAEIFSAAELVRDSAHISLPEALAGKGHNDCEAVVRARYPDMARTLDGLRRWGRPVMTGTGSGIFIEVKNEQQAKSTAQALKSLYNVRAVRGVDRSPLHQKLYSDGI